MALRPTIEVLKAYKMAHIASHCNATVADYEDVVAAAAAAATAADDDGDDDVDKQ